MNWKLSEKMLIQGANQPEALQYIQNRDNYFGSQITAGVSSGFQHNSIDDIPIFDLVEQAIATYGQIETTILFNSPYEILDAAYEAIAANIKQIIINTKGIPPLDLCQLFHKASQKDTLILGPGKGSIILPNRYCLGLVETDFFHEGKVSIINHGDSTLSYETALELNRAKLGESMVINLGSEKIIGMDFSDWLNILANDPQTLAIILIASDYNYLSQSSLPDDLLKSINKPIIAYVSDRYSLRSLSVNSNKMIADQVPFFLKRISSPENIINRLEANQIAIAYTPSEVIKSIQKLELT
jgi:succinyl-CoA synthetase alpha subunit